MGIKEALVLAFGPPAIFGLGTAGGFEFYIQNRGDGGAKRLQEVTYAFLGRANQDPMLGGAQTLWRATVPQVRDRVERTAQALTADETGLDSALSGRGRIWGAALCMAREHPVNGVGARSFREAFPACDPEPEQIPAWGSGPEPVWMRLCCAGCSAWRRRAAGTRDSARPAAAPPAGTSACTTPATQPAPTATPPGTSPWPDAT